MDAAGSAEPAVAALVLAAEAERREIAARIHDEPVQTLTALVLRLQLIRTPPDEPEDAALFAGLGEAAQTALASLRRLLADLSCEPLDRAGLADAVAVTADAILGRDVATVENQLGVEPGRATRVLVYRVAQDACRALAGAGVHQATLRLAREGGRITLHVSHDGGEVAGAGVLGPAAGAWSETAEGALVVVIPDLDGDLAAGDAA